MEERGSDRWRGGNDKRTEGVGGTGEERKEEKEERREESEA